MTTTEFWHLWECKKPPVMYGSLTESEYDELIDMYDQAVEKRAAENGTA
jgi:hypothetical protein